MSFSAKLILTAGARGSALSRAQIQEVQQELLVFHPEVEFQPLWVETTGDKDLKTPLRTLEKTDFFTQEIDAMQLRRECRISVHSAKDLPDPLPNGLSLIALTKGVDPSDSIVLRDLETLETLPTSAKIGTSSFRREKNIRELRSDFVCVDIRGDIQTRLTLLDEGIVDGIVMAEAALIRLKLTHRNRAALPGDRAHLQGQLAVLALDGDEEMQTLFQCIDVRKHENDALSGD